MENPTLVDRLVDCVINVIGPRNVASDVAVVRLIVSRVVADESPFEICDEAERLAAGISTHLKLEGLVRTTDPIVPSLKAKIELDFSPGLGVPKNLGKLSLSLAETEFLLALIRGKVIEIDALELKDDCFQKRLDAAEREILVSLKVRLEEARWGCYRPAENKKEET